MNKVNTPVPASKCELCDKKAVVISALGDSQRHQRCEDHAYTVPAEPRSAEQFYEEWAESNPESLWATKRPAKVAIAFAEAYAATLRDQLAPHRKK